MKGLTNMLVFTLAQLTACLFAPGAKYQVRWARSASGRKTVRYRFTFSVTIPAENDPLDEGGRPKQDIHLPKTGEVIVKPEAVEEVPEKAPEEEDPKQAHYRWMADSYCPACRHFYDVPEDRWCREFKHCPPGKSCLRRDHK